MDIYTNMYNSSLRVCNATIHWNILQIQIIVSQKYRS